MGIEFQREELLLGHDNVDRLSKAKVLIFGVGGVGGYIVEALARSGVGHIELVDDDTVNETNINRQIIALHSTVGRDKVEVFKERILDINPSCEVVCHKCFYLPENAEEFEFEKFDYVIDAIDTVTAKIDIIVRCSQKGVPVISAMGAGNKLDPTKFVVTDIYKTQMDPLARVMRRELKKRGVDKLKVVYSTEKALKPINSEMQASGLPENTNDNADIAHAKRSTPGSISFVPPVCGLIIAGEVIKDITDIIQLQ
ncbi:MAG: tRNA threonylcarbamoyladenosine dehydratase [Butyrivibrio sp.]|nr:tRNA threonylcarbamoyladenosine dehydratase [Butyrivibrio sp.]